MGTSEALFLFNSCCSSAGCMWAKAENALLGFRRISVQSDVQKLKINTKAFIISNTRFNTASHLKIIIHCLRKLDPYYFNE